MRAVITDGAGGIRFADLDEPVARHDTVLIESAASSLNHGDLLVIATGGPGIQRGLDVAGTVLRAAADGSGPPVGARVLGYPRAGGWGERVEVPSSLVVSIGADMAFTAAAVLPAAGLTAWRALAYGGTLLGSRVLVTGASGGVGSFAVQLALAGGAEVTAVVSRPERAAEVMALGDVEVVVGTAFDGPFDLALDGVGAELLTRAIETIAPRGTIVFYGSADDRAATIPPTWWWRQGGAQLVAMNLVDELERHGSGIRDLDLLVRLVATGRLDPRVSVVSSWHELDTVITAMRNREIVGKVALTID